jgi:hypothetical protein
MRWWGLDELVSRRPLLLWVCPSTHNCLSDALLRCAPSSILQSTVQARKTLFRSDGWSRLSLGRRFLPVFPIRLVECLLHPIPTSIHIIVIALIPRLVDDRRTRAFLLPPLLVLELRLALRRRRDRYGLRKRIVGVWSTRTGRTTGARDDAFGHVGGLLAGSAESTDIFLRGEPRADLELFPNTAEND